jgi:hypothetical protein
VPGVDSASKNEYEDTPGGKNGWFHMADNLQPSSANVKESGSLNLPEPSGPHRPVKGLLFLFKKKKKKKIYIYIYNHGVG